jgi:hypothetical protein
MKTAEQELRELRSRMKAFEARLREVDSLCVVSGDDERPLSDHFLLETMGPEPECLAAVSDKLPSYERNRIIHQVQALLSSSNDLLSVGNQVAQMCPEHMRLVAAWEASGAKRRRPNLYAQGWPADDTRELEIEFDGLRFVIHEDDWHSPTEKY